MITPILLVLGSLAIFILEVLVVSFGILSIVAITLGISGILMAFQVSAAFGWSLTGVMVVGAPLSLWSAFRILPRVPFARGFFLRAPQLTEEDRRAAAELPAELLGAEGEAASPLRPAGTAVFDGAPRQVVSSGTMIPRGTRVRVIDVKGNRIVVEEV